MNTFKCFNILLLTFFLISFIIIFLHHYNNNNNGSNKKMNHQYNKIKPLVRYNSTMSKLIILNFFNSIKESKVFSQNGEDGVLQSLISTFKLPKYNGTFVEFGVENGNECNTRNLRQKFDWTGLLMDGSNQHLAINLHREEILYANILNLFEKYKVKKNVDILSEDTDYADYWIVQAIIKSSYRPKIIVHEVNQKQAEICVTVPKPHFKEIIWWTSGYGLNNGGDFHGASVCAFYCLAKENGYTMVSFI